jgi:hypothetical protein
MSYYNKYLKYKNKYIILQNQIGGNLHKRLTTELADIGLVYDSSKNEYNFNYNDINFNIILSNKYPFNSPKINQISFPQHGPTKFLKYYLNLFNKSMLIYCHDSIISYPMVEGTSNRHTVLTNNDLIEIVKDKGYLIEDYNINTLDIVGSPTFMADGFSDVFIEQNENIHSIVLLPDCSGPWFDTIKRQNQEYIIFLILKILRIVKPGGTLYCGKFGTGIPGRYYGEIPDLISNSDMIDILVKQLIDRGYNASCFISENKFSFIKITK